MMMKRKGYDMYNEKEKEIGAVKRVRDKDPNKNKANYYFYTQLSILIITFAGRRRGRIFAFDNG